jgi:DNA-binding LytR/AlgR family response regulator
MDIEMPGMNGLQVANLLHGKPVIFTTGYKEYAAEAFDLDAVDYVRKPVKKERLEQAVQKAVKRLASSTRVKSFIQLNTDKGKAIIFFDQLLYIKSSDLDSRDKTAWLTDGVNLTLKNISFEKLLELLPPDEFCRINKKEVIAIKVAKVFSFDEITTTLSDNNGEPLVLSLSEVYRNDFIQKIKV